MALQPISETGSVYAGSGYAREPATRALAIGASYQIAGTLLSEAPLRPVSEAGLRADVGGFLRVESDRMLSHALSAYAASSFLSFLNLRVLSQPLASYAFASLVRAGAERLLSPSYLLFIPEAPAPPADTAAPVVANFDPVPGTPIARTAAVSFDVTDESGDFRRIFVVAFYPATGATEVVHDGDAFRGHYAASSSRAMIAAGFRYSVLRTGGWPAAPTIQTFAIDRAGNEAS